MVLTAWGSGPKKSRHEPAKMEPTSPVHNPTLVFRNYRFDLAALFEQAGFVNLQRHVKARVSETR
jgi:hypothetical protein